MTAIRVIRMAVGEFEVSAFWGLTDSGSPATYMVGFGVTNSYDTSELVRLGVKDEWLVYP